MKTNIKQKIYLELEKGAAKNLDYSIKSLEALSEIIYDSRTTLIQNINWKKNKEKKADFKVDLIIALSEYQYPYFDRDQLYTTIINIEN